MSGYYLQTRYLECPEKYAIAVFVFRHLQRTRKDGAQEQINAKKENVREEINNTREENERLIPENIKPVNLVNIVTNYL